MNIPDLCAAYVGGRSLPSLAREHRKTHHDIALILRASGVTIRPRGRQPTPERDLARSMLRDGASTPDVVRATGLTVTAVLGIRWAMRRAP